MPFFHEFFGISAFLIGLLGTVIYIRSILKGQTRPHVFTHLIWGVMCGISFAAQLYDHAGPGAWAMGLSTIGCLTNAALALKYGEKNITFSDKVALSVSISAIIIWAATQNPLWSVILISLIDVVAFYPTVRKSWGKPLEENLSSYNIASLKMGLSLVALANFTPVTALYPAVVLVVNSLFVVMCLMRRHVLKTQAI